MKHKSLKAFLLLLIFSVAMALISAKNYVTSLNTVAVTNTFSNTLRTQDTATGFLHFASTITIDLPEQCRIEKVLVSIGDEVNAGQSLLQLHYDDLLLCRLQLLLSKEQMKDRSGLSDIEKEIAALKAKTIDEKLARIEYMIAADGIIKSTVSGQVVELPSSTGGVVELGVYSEGVFCTWEVPKANNRAFTSFSAMVSEKAEAFTIDAVCYDAAKGVYQYQSDPFRVTGSINTAFPIDVSLVYVSDEYRAVLPKGCIRADSDGSTFVYVVEERQKVYGKELYLYKKGVTVLEQDDNYAAIIANLENVVEYAFKTPANLEAVRVIE